MEIGRRLKTHQHPWKLCSRVSGKSRREMSVSIVDGSSIRIVDAPPLRSPRSPQ